MMFRYQEKSASYHVDFGVNINAELVMHVTTDGIAQIKNFLTSGTAAIDKDKGLFIVNACTT